MSSKLSRSIIILVLVMGPAVVSAQDGGTIEGSVTLDDGSGVGGVTVLINELELFTDTDANGRFGFSDVPAGTYTLSFSLGDNFSSMSGISVSVGETTSADHAVDWVVTFAESIYVTGASRRAERIVDAPAAVSVVTAVEIERQAAHGQAPKLIEFTPGAEVTQSGIYDFNINTRGFNSSLNRRVATIIDGRNPSVPFLGAQEWAAVSYPLDDFSTVELVRGPSAALYGANASSGVLNMITKAPREYEGGQLRLTGGELSTFNADLRWAGSLGSDWYVKVVGGIRDHDDWAVSRNGAAEYSVPCTEPGQIDCLPQEAVPLAREDDDINFYGLRFDKYFGSENFLTIEAGNASIEGPVFQTGIGRVQLVEVDRPWVRLNYFDSRYNVAASYNKRDAAEQLALRPGNNLALDSENISLEVQANWEWESSRLVVGASYEDDDIDSLDPKTGQQTLIFAPISEDASSVFGQFDWTLSDNVRLVLAGRVDDGSLFDTQFSPKVAVVWSVNPKNTLRFTYNEAFQVANYSEFFLDVNVGVFPGAALEGFACLPTQGTPCGFPALVPVKALGNATLEIEEISTFEIGYSGILGNKTLLTVDAYTGNADNFITDLLPQLLPTGLTNPNFGPFAGVSPLTAATLNGVVGMFIPGAAVTNNVDGSPIIAAVSYTNFGDVDISGLDLGLTSQFANNWTLNFTYSYFDFDVAQELPGFENLLVPNTPENKLAAGLAFNTERWNASLSGRWVDEFPWAVGPFVGPVESYTTVDLNAEYALSSSWRLGAIVTNLLDDEHYQSFGGDLLGRRALATLAFEW